MKIVITVKDTDNVIGLKEDIAMRLEGVADIVRIDTDDVVPKGEVAREIFEELDQYIEQNGFGQFYKEYIKDIVSELKKKYTEGNNG